MKSFGKLHMHGGILFYPFAIEIRVKMMMSANGSRNLARIMLITTSGLAEGKRLWRATQLGQRAGDAPAIQSSTQVHTNSAAAFSRNTDGLRKQPLPLLHGFVEANCCRERFRLAQIPVARQRQLAA